MKVKITAAALAVAVSTLATGSAHADCRNLGAIGTGINEGIAKFMAEHGLANVRDEKGYKPSGAISYKCSPGAIVTECSARQHVCK